MRIPPSRELEAERPGGRGGGYLRAVRVTTPRQLPENRDLRHALACPPRFFPSETSRVFNGPRDHAASREAFSRLNFSGGHTIEIAIGSKALP